MVKGRDRQLIKALNFILLIKNSKLKSRCRGSRALARITLVLILFCSLANGCSEEIKEDEAAIVNGRVITMTELAEATNPWVRESGLDPEDRDMVRKVLDQLIVEELIVQEAGKLGVGISREDMDRRVREIKADFPESSFEDILVREYINLEDWKEKLRRNLLVKKVTETALSGRIAVDPEEWKAFYNAHSQVEPVPGRVKVRHITVPTLVRAEKIRQAIEAGRDFEVVSEEILGKDHPRDLDSPIWVSPDRLPATMAQAIEKTEPGGFSKIVKSEFGYSIFRVLEVEEPRVPDATEIMAELKRRYREYQNARAFEEWVGELKEKSRILINPDLAGSLSSVG